MDSQAALGVAQDALEREKGGIKALQEQLQSGKVSCIGPEIFFLWVLVISFLWWVLVSVGEMRVGVVRRLHTGEGRPRTPERLGHVRRVRTLHCLEAFRGQARRQPCPLLIHHWGEGFFQPWLYS